MTNEGDASNVENGESVAATLEQSAPITADDTQANSETVSTTPKEIIPDTQSESTITDSQVSSTKEVTFSNKNKISKYLLIYFHVL